MLCGLPVRDPYEVLGVGRNATEAEVKAAFRRLAAQHHPDKNQGDPAAQQRFTEINLAHQILSDPDKRSAYDRYGPSAFQAGGRGGPGDIDFGGLDEIFGEDRKSTRLNSSHSQISYAVFCLKKKKN